MMAWAKVKVAAGIAMFVLVVTTGGALVWPVAAYADDRVMVEATIDGKSVHLAFDTGSSHSFLFSRTVERLSLKTQNPSTMPAGLREANITAQTQRYELRFLSVITQTAFAVMETPRGVNADVDGVIGWLSLRDNVIVVDGAAGSVQISNELPPEAKEWQRLPIRRTGTLQLEVGTADGAKATVLIDSGDASGVHLSAAAWQQWAQHPQRRRTLVAFLLPADGLVLREQCWADAISLGNLTLTDVPVSQASAGEDRIPGFAGSLGLYALRRLSLVVDGKNDVAYVKPSDAVPAPFAHNRAGAIFIPKDLQSDELLAHVVPGSPADRAGVRDGDKLLAIGKLDVTRWRSTPGVMPLSRFFERPAGTELELTIERSGTKRGVTVVLEDILSPASAAASRPAP